MTRIDEQNDPVRIFTCMRTAAEEGLTPRVRYVNTDDGVSITDFVEAIPLSRSEALVKLPETLRKLHSLPPFPKTFNYVTAHNFFVWKLRKASLLPNHEIDEVFTQYEKLRAVYPRLDSDIVSSHMDLKPENVLFDGQRVWLSGWKAAFLNDRYFDLAILANFLVDDADERTYLERYFGHPPDNYQRARFFLMHQVLHMLSAAVFLMLGSQGKPIRRGDSLPSFRDFHASVWAGEIDLADDDRKNVYGLIHWDQLLENVRTLRFPEALGIVAGRNAKQDDFCLLLPRAQFESFIRSY